MGLSQLRESRRADFRNARIHRGVGEDPDKLEELPGLGERMAEHLQEI